MTYRVDNPNTVSVRFQNWQDMSGFMWNFKNSRLEEYSIIHEPTGTQWGVKRGQDDYSPSLQFFIKN